MNCEHERIFSINPSTSKGYFLIDFGGMDQYYLTQ
jgi:hypothetical protein